MADKELMQQVLYTLEHFYEYGYDREDCFAAITTLSERLAQPQRREWVGLTEEEVRAVYADDLSYRDGDYQRYARAIEAKLKEKNA